MTHLYYVRHAQPDYSVHDDLTRPLTEKGMRDCALVTAFLADKSLTACSPVLISAPWTPCSRLPHRRIFPSP